ncbi:MAG: carbohydrate ABC transporter permease [Treponema sp.]|jgi:multiple sugar transport system permease protein/putative aldouronate transport system permease protein|nr:carbohydrate ABC transporter permease [Treponema sp.]
MVFSIKRNPGIRESAGDKTIALVCYSAVFVFTAACVIPFMIALSASFSDELSVAKYGFSLFPRKVSLSAYKMLFKTSQIYQSYGVSLFVTFFGTLLSLLVTVLIAYPLASGKLKYGNRINFFVYFTMLFNGGLIPTYMLISRYLHLKDNLLALIIPVLINPWNMFLMRNFFMSVPSSLAESARIDGANEISILFRIILPVSVPSLAAIGLFYALGYWNNWFQAMLFIDRNHLQPLQMMIMKMLRNVEFMTQMAGQLRIQALDLPSSTIKMATAMVTIGPIVLLYPFLQRYFTSGIMVGAVKG